MALLFLILGFLLVIVFFFMTWSLIFLNNKTNKLPKNWPLIGSLPDFFLHIHHLHDRFTQVLDLSGCTFLYKGPFFARMNILLTVDPSNVHYVMSQNFSNFPKGPKFRKIFDILGDGIFNSDHDSWRDQRRVAHTLMNRSEFVSFSDKTNWDKLKNGLVPILDRFCDQGEVVELQDLFQRFTFDATSVLVSGYDPDSLSYDFPDIPYMKALDDVEEVLLYRHVIPKTLIKLQRRFGFGQEKKHQRARETLDRIILDYVRRKRDEISESENNVDMLTSYFKLGFNDEKFLRDAILNFMTAGRDTTSATLSWFFYLLSANPTIKNKIIQELEPINHDPFNASELNRLVYLHASFCETLRLYPPLPLQHKAPLRADVLPSGHRVDPKSTVVVLSIYAMGRMRSIWGEDCLEFRPERWITERGTIRHEPSYKFLAFNAGPRTCLGKDLAFRQMKMVAATLIYRYDIEVVEGHVVEPCLSILLHMKHGLRVRVSKRHYP